jgi:membrane protein
MLRMTLARQNLSTAKRSNVPAWIAGMALLATFAVARVLERGQGRAQNAAQEPMPRPEPKRDAVPTTPPKGWAAWKAILYRTYTEVGEDRMLALAAGVVFYALLALFPAITALVSCYALFANPATVSEHLRMLSGVMPESAFGIVNEQIGRIVSRGTGQLSFAFLLSLAFAIWSANSGMKAIIDALNVVYDVKERRGFIKLNLVSLAYTVGCIVGLLLALAAVVALPIALSYLPAPGLAKTVAAWGRWPLLLLLLLLGFAILYRFGPDRDNARWQWISPGALVAAVAWLAGSALLSWYLSNFANYSATYGSLGAGIGLMMWLWMSAIVILFGAELNSQIDLVQTTSPRDRARIGG